MTSFFRDVEKLKINGGSFAIKHGPDYSQQITNNGASHTKYDYSERSTSYGTFNNHGQFIETNNGEVNNYGSSVNNQNGIGRVHMREQRLLPRHDYEDHPPYPYPYGHAANYQRGYQYDRHPPRHGPPYPSPPPVDRYSYHDDIYYDEDPHDYPPENIPRVYQKSKPDTVPELEAEILSLTPHMQQYVRKLERKARKVNVLSDADKSLPDTMARMDLNDSDNSSPGPFSSEIRTTENPPPSKHPVDYFASNAARSRSHSPDSELTTSDRETFPNFRVKNVDSSNITTEYISDFQNNNSTHIETVREVKGRRRKKADK